MGSKKTANYDDLFADLDDISSAGPDAASSTKRVTKSPANATTDTTSAEDDPLAELSALASARPTSRPSTPRLSSSTTSGTTSGTGRQKTPASSGAPSARTSIDQPRTATALPIRQSTESTRGYHQPQSASVEEASESEASQGVTSTSSAETTRPYGTETREAASPTPNAGGGWWGSVFTAASAAVKQAEAAVKEIRGNEEAQKWAQQVKGNVDVLKQYSVNARQMAMPTFTNLLQTIAPPISAHERLQIHTTHDILGYPSLDPLIYNTFARVMSQVEGGDLLVIQRGSESRARGRSASDVGYRGRAFGGGPSGWTDGPWWRDDATKRDLGAVPGLVEGTKLARANAESYAKEFFASRGGLEEAAKHATETLSESNPVRSSSIFLAIQPTSHTQRNDLFMAGPKGGEEGQSAAKEPEETEEDTTAFALYLHDPVHSITFSTLSQSFPSKWTEWMDASGDSEDGLPDSIREMIESGGVDAREWVSEWLEEVLSLAIGTVAQRYVAKRMGVGEGGIGRGKRAREEEGTAGEAARAI